MFLFKKSCFATYLNLPYWFFPEFVIEVEAGKSDVIESPIDTEGIMFVLLSIINYLVISIF